MNYCPLVWMSATGANLTPDKLPASEMQPVEQACLKHLAEVIELLDPSYLVGVGGFAEDRLTRAAAACGSKATVGRVLHPSPASSRTCAFGDCVALCVFTASSHASFSIAALDHSAGGGTCPRRHRGHAFP
jgi:hypothetical protein